jgi:signal peptidase I
MNITEKIFKIFKKAAVVLWWSFTVLLMFTIIAIMGAKMKGKIPYFFGYSVMNIVSGSMEDTIPQGSYILIKKTDPSEIRKGDIICFFSDDPAIKGFPNTHTVVEDPIVGENGIEFVTKGEANLTKDEETAKGNKLIGKQHCCKVFNSDTGCRELHIDGSNTLCIAISHCIGVERQGTTLAQCNSGSDKPVLGSSSSLLVR